MSDKFSNANPQFKDSLFRNFFNDPNRLLSLCNAVLDTNFSGINDIVINTLETNFFSAIKNDISCKLGENFLVLIEHQSTVNENMPFRCLTYVTELLNNLLTDKKLLYKRKLITFPAPNFFVFYDGNDESEPVEKILKLSDSFGGSADLELIVHSTNINFNRRAELLQKCSYLNEYSIFICYVKSAIANGFSRRNAIIQAVDRCIKENIMKDYLIQKKDEVFSMLDFQWNLDDAKIAWRDEGREEGRNEGIESVALNMLRKGKSLDEIVDLTELSIQRIQQLAQSFKH